MKIAAKPTKRKTRHPWKYHLINEEGIHFPGIAWFRCRRWAADLKCLAARHQGLTLQIG